MVAHTLHEPSTVVDHRDGRAGALGEQLGGRHAGVSGAQDHDARCRRHQRFPFVVRHRMNGRRRRFVTTQPGNDHIFCCLARKSELVRVGDGADGDDAVAVELGDGDPGQLAVQVQHECGLPVHHVRHQADPLRVLGQGEQVAQDLLPADQRTPQRRCLAATVGPGDHVLGQHPLQRRHVAGQGGLQEPLHELAALLGRGGEPRARGGDMLLRPAVQLPDVRLVHLEDLRDLAVAVTERLSQHEHRPLRRGEPLQQHQHPQRQQLPLLHNLQRVARAAAGDDRLGQPRPDIALPLHPRRREPVQAQVGDHLGQPCLR